MAEGRLPLKDIRDKITIVFNSVADPDPFNFGQPDPDPGSKKSSKIMENFNKNHKNIIHFFQ